MQKSHYFINFCLQVNRLTVAKLDVFLQFSPTSCKLYVRKVHIYDDVSANSLKKKNFLSSIVQFFGRKKLNIFIAKHSFENKSGIPNLCFYKKLQKKNQDLRQKSSSDVNLRTTILDIRIFLNTFCFR